MTKKEKERIKESRPSGVMSEEEWEKMQGMTHSEFNRQSSVGSFLDELEKKYKKS